uniref:Uncharacterized protein n=1 Tax=Avena sativa TaxID=4498 RepID=A0ACD5TC57_AVESA
MRRRAHLPVRPACSSFSSNLQPGLSHHCRWLLSCSARHAQTAQASPAELTGCIGWLHEMEELQLHRRGGMGAGAAAATVDDQGAGGGKKKTAAAVWIALPLIRPVKVGRRRHGDGDGATEEDIKEEEEVTTPRGEGCRIPAEAATCPPAPKKARTGAVAIVADRRCNRDDGEVTEYYRVPADLDSVFAVVGRVAEAN